MEIYKKDDPAVLDALKPAPGRDWNRGKEVHDAGVNARKAQSIGQLLDLEQRVPTPPVWGTLEKDLERGAALVLEKVGERDANFRKRIQVAREERRFTASQLLMSWAFYILDRSLHLEIPAYISLEPGPRQTDEGVCPVCTRTFTRRQPGQIYDTQDCGYIALRERQAAEKKAAKKQSEKLIAVGMVVTADE